jgi:glyoxylase-like metal-dependent hydrolase (beta-lactamase superfamily II)
MEILPQLYQVDGVQGNCYILERDGLVLIDTGLPRNSKKILSFITGTLKRDPKDLKYIIITHYHADHTGNVAELRRMTGAKVAIHEADADYLAGKKAMAPLKGLRGRVLGLLLFLWPSEPVNPDILLHEGDNISGMRCIHTPGHTPGSLSLYDPELRVVFCGDTLITKNGDVSGPPPSATPDIAGALKSAKKISLLEFDVLLSGHGIPARPGAWEKVATFCASQKK